MIEKTARRNGYATFGPETNALGEEVYRYELGGDIGDPLFTPSSETSLRLILWIMLNPSTAIASKDDQTIATIVRFSERWGYHRVMVGNLYAFRTKSPQIMWDAWKRGIDIVGPRNDEHLARMVKLVRASGGEVMGAWGTGSGSLPARTFHRTRVAAVAEIAGGLRCLRTNEDGSPVHPLYQKSDLIPLDWKEVAA